MPAAVRLRDDDSAEALRALAGRSKDVNQSRRLLSLAAVRDGMDRRSAAKIAAMDRQTLRDWVDRFNASGPEGLIDNWTEGPTPACRKRGRVRADCRGRSGSGEGRRRALAADRPQAGHRRAVRGGLSSALCRQTSAQARLLVDAPCEAWRKLIADPARIASLGMRDWAHGGQSL
jgi:transposase